MTEWKEYKLGALVQTNKKSINSDYPFKEIEYLDTGSITRGKIHSFQRYKLSEAPSRAKRLVEQNDIVYSTVRPIQRHYGFIEKPQSNLVVSTGFTTITCDTSKLNPKYLYYLLTSDDSVEFFDLIAEASTSAYPSLRPSDIENLDIIIPELPEQRAIASILSSLDDKIDLLHRQNKTLEQMAEALFRQWFVVEASEEWEWHQIGEFVEVMRGLSYKGSGLTDRENGVPMHNLNSVFEGGGYKYEGIKYYSGDYKERHLTQPGDIIVTNTEQGHEMLLIGYPAIVPKFFGEKGIFSQHIYNLNLMNDILTKPFLYYLLMTIDIREQIIGATNGSTVNMLSKDGIEWTKFKLPPQYLIKKFTDFVIPIHKKEEENQTQIRTLEKLRDTLLPKLMSGEVKVSIDKLKKEIV